MPNLSRFSAYTLLMSVLVGLLVSCGYSPLREGLHSKVSREALQELDAAMSQSGRYTAVYQHILDSLGRLGDEVYASGNIERAWHLYMETAERYRSFNTDSALLYSMRAEQVARQQGDKAHWQLRRLIEISSLSGWLRHQPLQTVRKKPPDQLQQ